MYLKCCKAPHTRVYESDICLQFLLLKKLRIVLDQLCDIKQTFFLISKQSERDLEKLKLWSSTDEKLEMKMLAKYFVKSVFFTQKEQFMVLKNIKIRQKPWIRIHTCNTIVLLTCRTYKRIYFPFPMRSITYWIIFFLFLINLN